ncbi:hypothetical protein A5722_04705 [Mycobacterium vulneris]|nr:hypothetical protein A5722_04705 [Mycolicibacterium vulneris]OCB64363.1 hypothetical protein A5729_21855 [Mycolicibacterium vulneris]
MAEDNPGRNRRGECKHCHGQIYRYPLGDSFGAWSHLDTADWIENPHNPEPVELVDQSPTT